MSGSQHINSGTWVAGKSGNPKGRPLGSGRNQKQVASKSFEEIQRKRLFVALGVIQQQQQIIDDYIACNGSFPALVADGGQLVEAIFNEPEQDVMIPIRQK